MSRARVTAAVVLFAVACLHSPLLGEEAPPGEKPEAKPPAGLNTADAKQVGEAFWHAMASGALEAAAALVLPEQREEFVTKAIPQFKEFPPLPKELKITVQVEGESARAIVEGWGEGDGISMSLRDGRWWIVK